MRTSDEYGAEGEGSTNTDRIGPIHSEISIGRQDLTAKIRRESPHALNSAGERWIITFIALLFCFQIGIFFLGNSAVRLPLRIGGYAISLSMIQLVKGRFRTHPSWRWAQAAILVLLAEVINSSGDSILARFATVALYSAVLAPILWIGRVALSRRVFRAAIFVMWGFYTASALMGVFQVSYPGKFDGAISNNFTKEQIGAWTYKLSNGRTIIRPKGLSDSPGGASIGGTYAIILGTGLLLAESSWILRGVVIIGMISGVFCIFLCEQRTNLLVCALATTALIVVLLRRRSTKKAMAVVATIAGVAVVGTVVAFAVGGAAITDRFSTLIDDNPTNVFQASRGQFLNELIYSDIYEFPLGAGEGRWGMINSYFGSDRYALWAEMQWQALVFDGGIPLILIYIGLLISLLWTSWRFSIGSKSDFFGCWAGVVVGYNIAAIAATFVFPVFSVQLGMEVTFINACLYSACTVSAQSGLKPLAGSRVRPPRVQFNTPATAVVTES